MKSKNRIQKWKSGIVKWRFNVRKFINPTTASINIKIDMKGEVSILVKGRRDLVIYALEEAICEDPQFNLDTMLASQMALHRLESRQAVAQLIKETLHSKTDLK